MKKPTALGEHIYYYEAPIPAWIIAVSFLILGVFVGLLMGMSLHRTDSPKQEIISPIPDSERVDKNPEKFKITPTPSPKPQSIHIVPEAYAAEKPVDYKSFIYFHESGNNPAKWNGSGCVGLGQACPASKLLAVCPNLDYACEDQFFTQYMLDRYGSWENAYYKGMSRGRAGINGGWGWW